MMNFSRIYVRALKLLGNEAWLGWSLAGANVALALAQFAEPYLLGKIINTLVGAEAKSVSPAWDDLMPLLGAWVGFGLFTIVCSTVVALYADRLAHRRRHVVLTAYFEHVLQLPLSYHGGTHSGRLMKVMLAGTDSLWWLWLGFFREHLAAFIFLLGLLPFTIFLNWRLALLLILLCVIFTSLTALVLHKAESLQSAIERHYSDLAERTSDALGNVALVQSFARVEAEVVGLKNVVAKLLGAQMPVLSWWAMAAVITRASTTLTLLAIYVVGIVLYIHHLSTIGEIVMFTSYAGLLVTRLEQAVGFANRLFLDAPKLKEFYQVYDTVPEVRDALGAIDAGRVRGMVEFNKVSFSHDGVRPAVADLDITVLPGETVALVGPTGAGKSTALALLYRVFDPQSGSVKIDGKDIRGLKLASLRRNIGVVFQEVLLFNRTIAENLRIGNANATDDELRAACKRAQALDFIDSKAEGMQASVGERGRALSGGERQRISIARALLKDPPILILDEATSALDATTEVKVQAALEEVMKGRTTFVIAHRLATIRNATRILVFDHGHIVESGSFDTLMKNNGPFAVLAKAQFLAAGPMRPQIEEPAELDADG
jgi:ATP-binding cassette, subfamily B, beta-glucan exporter